MADLVSEGIEATVPATVRETVEAVKRVQEGIEDPPPPVGNGPAEADNPQDETPEEEVRNLFASDALEEA